MKPLFTQDDFKKLNYILNLEGDVLPAQVAAQIANEIFQNIKDSWPFVYSEDKKLPWHNVDFQAGWVACSKHYVDSDRLKLMEDRETLRREKAILLEASNKRIAELEDKLRERDSVRLWNENEELKEKLLAFEGMTVSENTEIIELRKKLRVAIAALEFYSSTDYLGIVSLNDLYKSAGDKAKEALEKIK